MSYRGRQKKRPVSLAFQEPQPRELHRATSSIGELAHVLESTHLATIFANSNRRTREAQIEPAVKYDQSKKEDVAAYVQGILGAITPSESQLLRKVQECRRLEAIVRHVIPNANLKVMGGTANTFALKDSDVDVCIIDENGYRALDAYNANRIGNALRERGYRVEILLHTFVPLIRVNVTLHEMWSTFQVELSWSNPIGIYKTELLAAYSGIDGRLKSLVQFVKHWAKARKLSNTQQGGMGSFAWSLMCIYFLIKGTHPPVLPSLQNGTFAPEYIQGINVGYSKNLALIYRSDNKETLSSLITKFFEFMDSFDFQRHFVSIRGTDSPMTKTDKGWTNNLVRGYGASGQRVLHSYYIAIEDPFEIANNAARTVNYQGFVNIKSEITRAARILKASDKELLRLSCSLCCYESWDPHDWI